MPVSRPTGEVDNLTAGSEIGQEAIGSRGRHGQVGSCGGFDAGNGFFGGGVGNPREAC